MPGFLYPLAMVAGIVAIIVIIRREVATTRKAIELRELVQDDVGVDPSFGSIEAKNREVHIQAARNRPPSKHFNPTAFGGTAAALVLAPIVAELNLAGSYLPFIALRLWLVGFSVYGYVLAGQAGGLRRIWRWFYGMMFVIFALIWGLDVEVWAVIDWACAVLIGASALFLRTEMPRKQGE